MTVLCGLPWWLRGKESACQCRRRRSDQGQEDPLEEEMATYRSILAGKSHGQKEPGGL